MIQATTRPTGRFALRCLTAAALACSLLGGVASGTASAGSVHVTVAADPMTAHVGSAIVISGKVTPRTAAPPTPVFLQRYVAGHWKGLSHHVTSATGHYSFSVKAPGKATTWIFRVVRARVASHTVHVKISTASFHVRAKTTPRVTAGMPLVVTGSVSPKARGPVRLQILRGKTWTTLSTSRLTRRSTFTLRAIRPAGAYHLRVVKPFTATIAGGVSATANVAVLPPTEAVPIRTPPTPTQPAPTQPAPTQPAPTQPALRIATAQDAVLAQSTPRVVFSAVRDQALPPAQLVTLTNSGSADATVSGIAVSDTSSFDLATGQPRSITVPAGGSATVGVQFHPTAPTGCPTAAAPYAVSGSNRNATLTFATTDPARPSAAVSLSGLVSCGFGGANEPVLHQVVQALGYTTVIDTPDMDQRFLKRQAIYPNTDELTAQHFRAADPASPVTVTDLAHYSSPSTTPYQSTGWYALGASLPTDGSCTTACRQLWNFPADPSTTTYNQNQMLLPTTVGTTAFVAAGVFGLFAGDNKDVVFSDEHLNAASAPHDLRVYPAYGAGHVAIPNTYLVAIDTGRVSESKNADYQDLVLIVRNVVPA